MASAVWIGNGGNGINGRDGVGPRAEDDYGGCVASEAMSTSKCGDSYPFDYAQGQNDDVKQTVEQHHSQ
jgi:hypothetical protein